MIRKLYGLFIYKLQYTSFFSIMERVTGFLLIFGIYYFFLQEIVLNYFFYNNALYNIFQGISLLMLILILYYFSFHLIAGIRIYLTSLYYSYSLKKKPLSLNLLYSFKLIEKNSISKLLISFLLNAKEFINNAFVKSNSFFLLAIFAFFFFVLMFLF